MSKHTPGPWVCIKKRTEVGYLFKVGTQSMVDASHGAVILYDDYTSLNPHKEGVVEANAHLIAAAPDLLEMLQGVVRMIQWAKKNEDSPKSALSRFISSELVFTEAINKALNNKEQS